jgi:hypothetical protein
MNIMNTLSFRSLSLSTLFFAVVLPVATGCAAGTGTDGSSGSGTGNGKGAPSGSSTSATASPADTAASDGFGPECTAYKDCCDVVAAEIPAAKAGCDSWKANASKAGVDVSTLESSCAMAVKQIQTSLNKCK